VKRAQAIDRLDLDDDSLVDEHVQAIATIERSTLLAHWHSNLTSDDSPRRLSSWHRHSSYADSSKPGPRHR